MQHVEDERDTLTDRHEADHDGQNRRQKADDLGQNALKHGAGDNPGQDSRGRAFLRSNLPSSKNELYEWAMPMVAGGGFEPPFADAESTVLPLHYPAIFTYF